jgi:hypothetical protein
MQSSPQQLDLLEYAPPAARRDAAMTSVTVHAEGKSPGWTAAALAWIEKYAETHAFFISEECTQAAIAAGVPIPHDLRGWGSLYPKAARKGVIIKDGYGTSKRRNLSPTPMWRSLHPNFAGPA